MGCIPIYFGIDDVSEYIPESLFINGRNFPDALDVIRHSTSPPEEETKYGTKWSRVTGFDELRTTVW